VQVGGTCTLEGIAQTPVFQKNPFLSPPGYQKSARKSTTCMGNSEGGRFGNYMKFMASNW